MVLGGEVTLFYQYVDDFFYNPMYIQYSEWPNKINNGWDVNCK